MLKNLKQLIKASGLGFAIFSLTACSTIEIVHVPVGCVEQSPARLGFTDEEMDSTSDEMTDKLVIFAGALRERLNTQCLINKKHDELHK